MRFDWRLFLTFWGIVAAGAMFVIGEVLLIQTYGMGAFLATLFAVLLAASIALCVERKKAD